MKYIFLILGMTFIIVCICSCNNKVPANYIEYKVELKNNLGELTISLPPEFDTAYSWIRYSDNRCADLEMFRFANKKYSLFQETGFFYDVIPDSLYQLTITQSKHLNCDDTNIRIDNKLLEVEVERYKCIDTNIDIVSKEIENINNKKYIVIEYKSKMENVTTLSLLTEINGHFVILEFICRARNCSGFINRIKKSLNSIKITPGNIGLAASLHGRSFEMLHSNISNDLPQAIECCASVVKVLQEKCTITKSSMELKFDYIKSKDYIEYSFCLPINSIFYEKWDTEGIHNFVDDDKIIREIGNILEIAIDKEIVENKYWGQKNTVEIFHGTNPENFIYFDLVRDLYDQCDMIFLGVRLERIYEKRILELMLNLYFKTKGPCSNLQIDFFNQSLYHIVFKEDFYFYKQEKYKNRELIHYNLNEK